MIGLDCNILVQIAFADHPANAVTVAAVETEAQRGSRLIIPSMVIAEFLHVATDDRRFSPALTMDEALEWTDAFISNPLVEIAEPSERGLLQTLQWMRQFRLGRKRILDTFSPPPFTLAVWPAC